MGATPHRHIARVVVAPEIRRELASLDVELGRRRTLEVLCVSKDTLADALAPGGLLAPKVLARIEAALAKRNGAVVRPAEEKTR